MDATFYHPAAMVYYGVKAYVDILDNKARDGLELFVQMKME